jgi:hypothetical protein
MSEGSIRFGPFVLDPARGALYRDGAPVPLGQRALAVLAALAEAPGKTVGKEQLLCRAWPGSIVEERLAGGGGGERDRRDRRQAAAEGADRGARTVENHDVASHCRLRSRVAHGNLLEARRRRDGPTGKKLPCASRAAARRAIDRDQFGLY